MKIDAAVRRETGYIALCTLLLSAVMELVFILIGYWDYTVLLGNLLSFVGAVGNFFLMGMTVQRAVGGDESKASVKMKLSQWLRLLGLLIVAVIGVWLPWFNLWAVLIPLFFPRLAVIVRPYIHLRGEDL